MIVEAASAPTNDPVLWRTENFEEVGPYEQVGGWRLEAMQTTPGALACLRRQLVLDGLQWLDEELRNVTLSLFGTPSADSLVFGIVLSTAGALRVNGRTWRSSEVAVGPGGHAAEIVLPPGRVITLVVRRGVLADHLWLRDAVRLEEAAFAMRPMLIHLPTLAAEVHGRVLQLADAVAAHMPGETLSSPQAIALRSEILDVLADIVVAEVGVRAVPMHRTLQAEIVRQARLHVARNAGEALQVEDLCRLTRVSRRSLQRCFTQVIGVTPVQYLRLTRLSNARRMLLDSASDQRIQDVLAKLGIWHASRFAADYRSLFGELPSETLRQPYRAPRESC